MYYVPRPTSGLAHQPDLALLGSARSHVKAPTTGRKCLLGRGQPIIKYVCSDGLHSDQFTLPMTRK